MMERMINKELKVKFNFSDISDFCDCILLCDSGRRVPAIKGLLALKSRVFRDMFLSCGEKKETVSRKYMEIPMAGDTALEVELLWQHLHDEKEVSDEFEFLVNTETQGSDEECNQALVQRIFALTKIADKYDIQGTAFFASLKPP